MMLLLSLGWRFLAWWSLSSSVTLAAQSSRPVPDQLDDGWPTTELAAVGLDPVRVESALALLATKKLSGIDSLLLARDGRLAVEVYGKGAQRDRLHDLRSATKSITGLLVGIALDRGCIKSLDEPVATYFTDYVGAQGPAHFRGITVRHLLEMSSGLVADDWDPRLPGNEERMYRSHDWLRFFFALPADVPPGTTYRYCTAGVVVLGEIIARTCGQSVERFAAEHLFAPLGIREVAWAAAPRGVTDTGGHLRLRSRDFLKIGQLMLDGGQRQGRQIVSTAWLAASLQPRHWLPGAPPGGPALGLLWWLQPVEAGRAKSYQARGNGGQYLISVPERKLVAAFTGNAYNDADRPMFPFVLMKEHLIPAAQ